jgi:hypothetical protein
MGEKVTRQGCLDLLVRLFPVRTLTRKELDPIYVVIFLDGSAPFQSFLNIERKCWKLCTEAWPPYTLDGQEKWPSQGSLNYNTILQLDLFCKRKKKK